MREANHRITNNLAMIAGFVRLQAAGLPDRAAPLSNEEAWLQLQDIAARIETVGRLHRLLANAAQPARVGFADYLRETCETLVETLAPAGGLRLSTDFRSECALPASHILPLALILSEVITNAIKYAHPSGVGGRLLARCWSGSDDEIVVEVQDDGVGLPEGFDPEVDGGLGLRLVRSLAGQIGARYEFESDSMGLRFRLAASAVQL